MSGNACRNCEFFIGSVMNRDDHRCALDRRLGVASEKAALPTIEWMRSPAAVCGPHAIAFVPRHPAELSGESDMPLLVSELASHPEAHAVA